MISATSAKLRAPGGVAAPAKITSSIPPPRMAVGRFSPMTQRSASSRFDLPQPFGPTTPVSPSMDHQIRRVDKAFEAVQPKPGKAHRAALP